MRIINAGFKVIDIDNPVKKIERVARVCYKSEDKIKEGSAEKLVKALIKNNHTAMLEHASIVIELDRFTFDSMVTHLQYLEQVEGYRIYLRYSRIDRYIISGNIRAWREYLLANKKCCLGVFEPLDNIFKSDKYKAFFKDVDYEVDSLGYAKEIDPCRLITEEQLIHRDFTVVFTVDRGISHEIVRHRVASFAQESTRYCNYGKYGDVAFIKPCYLDYDTPAFDNWVELMMLTEKHYLDMLDNGATPQEARIVLPQSLKTELAMTTNLNGWRHFFKLRAVGVTGKPHPQMLEVAVPLLEHCKTMIPVVFDDLEVKEC